MKSFRSLLAVLTAGVSLVGPARAQVDADALAVLKAQLSQLTNTVHQLQEKVSRLEAAPSAPPPQAVAAAAPVAMPARAGGAYMNISFDSLVTGGWSTDSEGRLNRGGHDPAQRGFSLPNEEIVLSGAVDPYLKGTADIVMSLDEEGETAVELEEAFLLTTGLPGNLQVKAGQFFTEFGRQNAQHPHAWAFVDQPLVINRLLGPDGLRNPGARVSWLAPTPWFTELTLTAMNGAGETAWSFRNPEADFHGRAPAERGLEDPADLVYVPRLASSFDLSEEQTLLLGASAAVGPNDSGADANTRIYGLDSYWKWKPANARGGFPFVAWQTEVMWRDFEAGEDAAAGLPSETLRDWGLYSQILYGFAPRWVGGFRGEYVTGDDGAFADEEGLRADRTRWSPNLTFHPSEFSKFRLQYNRDELEDGGAEHSAWLQAEFLLGAHGAHKF